MALSWNEIRTRALAFQKNWEGVTRERAETQSFYNDFFEVFGISRKRVASFEEPVKKLGGKQGFIDLFWKGLLLVEQKSSGKNLKKAKEQAYDYFPNLKENELPQYILICDFNIFELYDLEADKEYHFELKDLHKNIELFAFIAGYTKKEYSDFEPANIQASELMGNLFDQLKESGYTEHDLELFLVRLLFCMFAEDTGIFEKDIFKYFIEERTAEDGTDTGSKLVELFQVLDTPDNKRQKTLDEDLARFAYINGSLFNQNVRIPAFNSKMRKALLDCCYFSWDKISPAIFGSLFQCVADKEKRRSLGEHYTTEKNIMKTISPLFLDDLKEELNKLKQDKSTLKDKKLAAFHVKLGNLQFLDPACGCGNFLVITYREIRLLELEVLKELFKVNKSTATLGHFDVSMLSRIDVDNFYGIEIDEFPANIAKVAMWLCDHQMNIKLSETFGLYYARIPLAKYANITHGNALTTNWEDIVSPSELSYILGNPPFVGKKEQDSKQKQEIQHIFTSVKSASVLDYVAAWYLKSAHYIQNTAIKCAFVSTNSITQGEQVAVLWKEILNLGITIHFAHRTFIWDSEASGKAHVHCVIIGFAHFDSNKKILFEYDDGNSAPHAISVKNISPYLIDFKNTLITKRTKSINPSFQLKYGSMPVDKGRKAEEKNNGLILEKEVMLDLIQKEPLAEKYIRQYGGGDELINNFVRYCLWLVNINPKDLNNMPLVKARVQQVRKFREQSSRTATKKLADTPTLFAEIRQPNCNFIAIPKVSSENRKYIPISICDKNFIANGSLLIIDTSDLYCFGMISSLMHMTWVSHTCGRLKSDYQYSAEIVYNNFVWPIQPNEAQVKKVEEKAQSILNIRSQYPDCSLAILYNPETMPIDLLKAHQALDKAVDACYGKKTFSTEMERMAFLFELYEEYVLKVEEEKVGKKSKK